MKSFWSLNTSIQYSMTNYHVVSFYMSKGQNMATDKKQDSLMSQKIIADKSENKISEFIVFYNVDFTISDWVFKPKFSEMVTNFSDKPVDYPLKRTIKGNLDEGKEPQSGKALRLSVIDDTVSVEVYTQIHAESWKLSHTHIIAKSVFDAYVLVIKNDTVVATAEKVKKSPENFSLNLG